MIIERNLFLFNNVIKQNVISDWVWRSGSWPDYHSASEGDQ